MSDKTIVMFGMIMGSLIGSYVASLFGAGILSYSSVIISGIGGIIGVLLAVKLTNS